MSSSDSLLKATLNRLIVRLNKSLADTTKKISLLVDDAPQRIQTEWDLFKEEVKLEAERIDSISQQEGTSKSTAPDNQNKEAIQEKIDGLRERLSLLNRKLD
ncbi:hypothetical protein [Prochlorococcus sp. MIT 1300]|uniref:hypothetical protein n=1 Tax=Prochlorococcus sp. MIT 1300 TaxID=3096218 RepID=UPI002A751EAC|nr:hypothetical protein [Prochlorococcus sp. MIT 1300]